MHRLKKGRIEAFMDLFRGTKALERLEERMASLETQGDDLKRIIRSLELEYIELYDKVRHQMSRMAKRGAVEARKNIAVEEEEIEEDGVDPISREILARRGGPRSVA